METPGRGLLEQRWLAVPLSYLFWAACVVIVIVWTPLVAAVRLVTGRSDPNREIVGRFQRRSAALAARINPFWDFRAIDRAHPDPSKPHLFVANHKSLADVFLLSLLPWEMKFLSKESIFRIPLLGWQMRVNRDIPIERGNKDSARRALEAMRDRLSRGSSVIVFPEGTRSSDGSIAPFREGAFRLAINLGVDVVPLAVAGTENTLPKHSLVFRPTRASVTALPAMPVAGLTEADAPTLAERVRSEIARAIGAPAPSHEPAARAT
jgi:1-acyl-sn-glycerol-3-phosphate acyltransferase